MLKVVGFSVVVVELIINDKKLILQLKKTKWGNDDFFV